MNNRWPPDRDEASILIIDDEPANLKLLNKMLHGMGYNNLCLIQDPRDVLTQYQQCRPDLILLDINMPYLDGFGVLSQLKELNDPLLPPIVVLTAQTGREYKLRALTEGARDFISKPFDQAELQARVRNLLDVHLAHRLMHDQKNVLDAMVRERTEELRHTRLQVIQRLGRAAEYRDNETGSHIIRMSQFSMLIAQIMGLSQDQCDLILHASPMHDIGKIGIPDHILLKPGKLDPDEWEIMKGHSSIGATLLDGDDSALIRMARSIALTHHEKWDGSGYPRGLVGSEIPIEGRIVAVADVFDALTSERPYKKAWSIDAAVDLIRDSAGSHFDPHIVECFLEVLPKVLAVRTQYSDSEVDLGGLLSGRQITL